MIITWFFMYHVASYGIDPVSTFKLNRQYRGQISSYVDGTQRIAKSSESILIGCCLEATM